MNDEKIKSNVCIFCGKKSRGNCIVLWQMICSYCCGTKRNEAINCSKDCEYNLLSRKAYDNHLKIDKGLIVKMLKYVIDCSGKEKFEKVMGKMAFHDESRSERIEDAAGAAMNYLLFVEPDTQGRTLVQKWESASWQGLTNDEKSLINYSKNSSLTVIEIQKVIDNQITECIDLLDDKNKKFILLDRSLASHFPRFTKMLVWIAHYPHFSRVLSNGIEVTSSIEREFMDELFSAYEKARNKNGKLTIKQFMAGNYGKLYQKIIDMSQIKYKNILRKIDLHQCKAIYDIKGDFNRIKHILDTYPEFEATKESPEVKTLEGSYYYSWLRRGASKVIEDKMPAAFRHSDDESIGVGSLANVVLNQNILTIEAFTKQKYAFAKKIAGKYFKHLIVLKTEVIVDLAKQIAGDDERITDNHPLKEKEEIPHEVKAEIMQKFNKNYYTKFLDDHVPALNGITPREAARDKKMRPALVELMKIHLKGIETQNRDDGFGLNIDWVLDELKLSELK